jgi:hypothetical protein
MRELSDKKLGFQIRSRHCEFLKNYIYTWHLLGDYYLVKYFTHTCKATNTRLFTVCICGEENIEGHAANDCKTILTENKRKQYMDQCKKIYKENDIKPKETLHLYLLDTYYVLEPSQFRDIRDLKKLIRLMKKIITDIIRYKKEEVKIIETHVSDNEDEPKKKTAEDKDGEADSEAETETK